MSDIVKARGLPVLEAKDLSKRFPLGLFGGSRQAKAVTGASFSVGRGEVLALVGESGSGKTTTLRMLGRLVDPSEGKILLDGQDIFASGRGRAPLAFRKKVQVIFQDPFSSLNPARSIAHHLERPLLIHGLARTRAELDEAVVSLLETVELRPAREMASRYPHQLSGGQRQRVAIARALAARPEIILADEPISMLDVSIRMGVLNLICRLKAEMGISFVYVTHDLASARYVGDSMLVMYAGRIVEGGPCEELLARAAHPYTRLLIASAPDPLRIAAAGRRAAGAEAACEDQATDCAKRAEPPSIVDPPPGCPFADRCPRAFAPCSASMPPEYDLGGGHWARCFLYDGSSVRDQGGGEL
jgi:peptide/nickel transport system ATP-binding protein